jgi:hypothetical protein
MNDQCESELNRLIERIVVPIKASRGRKRRMREELLAHLSTVFAEELATAADETAALCATFARFGEPGNVTRDLQEAVPPRDRLRAGVEILSHAFLSIVFTAVVYKFLCYLVLGKIEGELRTEYNVMLPQVIRMLIFDGFCAGAIVAHVSFILRPLLIVPLGVVISILLSHHLAYYVMHGGLPEDYLAAGLNLSSSALVSYLGCWLFRRAASPAVEAKFHAA